MTSRLLPTLFLFHAFVFALQAGLVYLIWRDDKDAEEYRWWFAALLVTCGGLVLFSIRDSAGFLSVAGGNALNLWGMGLVWAGVRVFAERPVRHAVVFAGGAIWLGGFLFGDFSVRLLGRALLIAAYSFLIAYELSTCQKERMLALHATKALAAAHGCFNTIIAVAAPFLAVESSSFYDNRLVQWVALEGMGFSIIFGYALLALSKERMVTRQKIAAETDLLTGLANRRCFDRSAAAALQRGRGREVGALLIFDLDCLKIINDRYGHSMGDRALTIFGEVAANNIRGGDLLARVGGDEFAAMLTHVDGQMAVAVAERIRSAYAAAASFLGDGLASVSVGVAVLGCETTSLAEFKERADSALYEAKATGRNRVCVFSQSARPAPRAALLTGENAARGVAETVSASRRS